MLKNMYVNYESKNVRLLTKLIAMVSLVEFNSVLLYVDKISINRLLKGDDFNTRPAISYALKSLVDDGAICKVKNGLYVINPNVLFYGRGSSIDSAKKVFSAVYKKKKKWRTTLGLYIRDVNEK